MFLLRAVYGIHKGEYYSGFDLKERSPIWANTADAAKKVSVEDAVGIITAMIDGPRVVVVPERLQTTTDDDCVRFADLAARNMFQHPSTSINEVIYNTIRNQTDPIYDRSVTTEVPQTGDHMSVWEWVYRGIAARSNFAFST